MQIKDSYSPSFTGPYHQDPYFSSPLRRGGYNSGFYISGKLQGLGFRDSFLFRGMFTINGGGHVQADWEGMSSGFTLLVEGLGFRI